MPNLPDWSLFKKCALRIPNNSPQLLLIAIVSPIVFGVGFSCYLFFLAWISNSLWLCYSILSAIILKWNKVPVAEPLTLDDLREPNIQENGANVLEEDCFTNEYGYITEFCEKTKRISEADRTALWNNSIMGSFKVSGRLVCEKIAYFAVLREIMLCLLKCAGFVCLIIPIFEFFGLKPKGAVFLSESSAPLFFILCYGGAFAYFSRRPKVMQGLFSILCIVAASFWTSMLTVSFIFSDPVPVSRMIRYVYNYDLLKILMICAVFSFQNSFEGIFTHINEFKGRSNELLLLTFTVQILRNAVFNTAFFYIGYAIRILAKCVSEKPVVFYEAPSFMGIYEVSKGLLEIFTQGNYGLSKFIYVLSFVFLVVPLLADTLHTAHRIECTLFFFHFKFVKETCKNSVYWAASLICCLLFILFNQNLQFWILTLFCLYIIKAIMQVSVGFLNGYDRISFTRLILWGLIGMVAFFSELLLMNVAIRTEFSINHSNLTREITV